MLSAEFMLILEEVAKQHDYPYTTPVKFIKFIGDLSFMRALSLANLSRYNVQIKLFRLFNSKWSIV